MQAADFAILLELDPSNKAARKAYAKMKAERKVWASHFCVVEDAIEFIIAVAS